MWEQQRGHVGSGAAGIKYFTKYNYVALDVLFSVALDVLFSKSNNVLIRSVCT